MNSTKDCHKSSRPLKVIHVVGARPNFMKIAPIIKQMSGFPHSFSQILLHTGQHYDQEMSVSFFNDLKLPKPDIYLGVGSGTHAEQTGKIMIEFEKICISENPDLVLVVGDVNSTVAAALVASKLCIPVAHIEAGLRSFDRTMPEEINRVVTDHVSDYLFTTCEDANQNLLNEGIHNQKIFFVGNVMIDALKEHIVLAKKSKILEKLHLIRKNKIQKYALLTLHRPSNVDYKKELEGIFIALKQLAKEITIVFPAHPRTMKQIKEFNLENQIKIIDNHDTLEEYGSNHNIQVIPPLGYLDFLKLTSAATLVLTDSGGIQEETTILGIPCLTFRNNTERPITIKEGTNTLVGNDPEKILYTSLDILKKGTQRNNIPLYWDGKAAKRIIKILLTIKKE